jgi:hypothetical protein
MLYCTSDILAFHVELRALFDQLAGLIASFAVKKGAVRDSSFEDLRSWLGKNPRNEARLGSDLSEIVRACNWFTDVRSVRDDLVHRGAHSIAFSAQGRILFQIQQRVRPSILVPEVMYNEQIADFERYAGLLFGLLLNFLDQLGAALFKISTLTTVGVTPAKSYHPGHETVARWIKLVSSPPEPSA